MKSFQHIRRQAKPRRKTASKPAFGETSRTALQEALGYPVQAKLKLGSPDDAHEREADAVADRVMAMPEGKVQRKCAACQEEDEKVQRATAPEKEEDEEKKKKKPEEENVQRSAEPSGTGSNLSGDASARIQSSRGRGEPLPAGERGFFEPRFGRNLERVRVHADSESADLSSRLGARAFTVGRDVYFASGEYRPGTPTGRHLMAHELTHVIQQGDGGVVRRWNLGAAPAPDASWRVVTDAEHLRRLNQAEDIVRGVVGNRNCQNYFRDNCTNGAGANALRNAFNLARVYVRPVDDNGFGESIDGTHNIAFNLRAFRIGRYMLASTLLHEMFHTCDPTGTGRQAELDAENSVESCRLHTPWIDTVSPRRGGAGTRVRIRGWNFGPTQGTTDSVRLGGTNATVISWEFMAGTASKVEIVIEVPAGASTGNLEVINNNVASNAVPFTVA